MGAIDGAHPVFMRVFFLIILISVLVGGLVLVWKQLPINQLTIQPITPTSTAITPPAPTSTMPVSEPVVTPTVVRPIPSGMICGEWHAICVSDRLSDSVLANPIMVTGTAQVFENQFAWSLVDASGTEIGSGNVLAMASGTRLDADFVIQQTLTIKSSSVSGTLMLYDSSPKDGSSIDVLSVPIQFSKKMRK